MQLSHHALAPLTDLPVLEVISGIHIISDLTLHLGEVVHNYLADSVSAKRVVNSQRSGLLDAAALDARAV